jgi:hypothetical protein
VLRRWREVGASVAQLTFEKYGFLSFHCSYNYCKPLYGKLNNVGDKLVQVCVCVCVRERERESEREGEREWVRAFVCVCVCACV